MSSVIKDRLPSTFWWANATQFGGAMNDNLFKLFMTYALIDWGGEENRTGIIGTVTLIFAVPFLIFIPIAGSFADHYSKRRIIVLLKATEFLVMSVGISALFMQSSSMLYVTIFLMSTQSAFFGPCKYGIIPEQVGSERLSRANGALQMFTFLAIIAGTVVAPALSEQFGDYHARAASVCLLVAAIGFLTSLRIEPSPAHPTRAINLNGFVNLYRTTHIIRRDGFLTLAVLAGSFFTLIGAFMQMNILNYGAEHLGYTDQQSTYLFVWTAIGIGIGSVFAGWISGRSIEFGIVPIGTALMFVSLIVIGTVSEGSATAVRLTMFSIGVGAGLYIVPLEAFIQYRSPKDKVGSIKAANSFLGWIGVVLASRLLVFNESVLHLNAQGGFLVVSVLLFVLAVLSFWVLPDFFMKFVMMCIVRCVYRLRVLGINNLPHDRAALLVCNHVTLMDALLVISSQQRRIRMLMSRRVFNNSNWAIRRIVSFAGVILIQDSDGPKKLVRSLKDARKALDDGYLVCIFAEGGLTLSGMMRPFKPGFERIIKGSDHPIIPVYIGGAWGSHASWKNGRAKINFFKDMRYPVSVHFGEALPSTSSATRVQQAVCEVSSESDAMTKSERPNLGVEFIHVASNNWNRPALVESNGKSVSYGMLLTQALKLGDAIRDTLEPGESRIGILAQNGTPVARIHAALGIRDLIAVPLDQDDPDEVLAFKIKTAGIKAVVTDDINRIEGLKVRAISLKALLEVTSGPAAASVKWKAHLLPSMLMGSRSANPDDDCTLQFTRGTTGHPKPVRLSHHNILSNVDALRSVIQSDEKSTMIGIIPQSNILGYTATTWLPLLSGMSVAYSSKPFDVVQAGDLCVKLKASILPATPGCIIDSLDSVSGDSFASLRYVFTGGGPLDGDSADAFEDKFGIRPLEAYGATELSPVCSLSLPNIRFGRFAEQGTRKSAAGRLLQGVSVRIVDPDSMQSLEPGETGLILVKGPNVMMGYADEEATRKAFSDGWYVTGDTGSLDEAGFLTIAGRVEPSTAG